MEKAFSINNFIGVYDNYITKEECDKAIRIYEEQNKFNNTINRIGFEGSYKNRINNFLLHQII